MGEKGGLFHCKGLNLKGGMEIHGTSESEREREMGEI